jgi:hypothetical protein
VDPQSNPAKPITLATGKTRHGYTNTNDQPTINKSLLSHMEKPLVAHIEPYKRPING